MSREEKKEVLKTLYQTEQELVNEVLNEMIHVDKGEPGVDKEIVDLVEKHFQQYDEVFKALA